VLGRGRYLLLYLGCGALAAIPHIVMNLGSSSPLAGASGAVSAVMAAYFVLFRTARLTIMLIFMQFKVSAPIWLGLWFGINVLAAWADPSGEATGIGWSGHVAGFVGGLLFVWPQRTHVVREHPLLGLLASGRMSA
jgi:membrane associated rhomboid family serine protease